MEMPKKMTYQFKFSTIVQPLTTATNEAEPEKVPKAAKSNLPTDGKSSSGDTGVESDIPDQDLPPSEPKSSEGSESNGSKKKNPKKSNCEGHRAGFDAFMTGR